MDKTDDGQYFRRIAKIKSTSIFAEDHGILTCFVFMDYGGVGQGFGGYALDQPKPGSERVATERETCPYAMDFLVGVMDACGTSWEGLPGRTVYVLFNEDTFSAMPVGLEPLPTEKGKRFLIADWQAKVQAADERESPGAGMFR